MFRLPSIFRRHRRVEDPAATPGRADISLAKLEARRAIFDRAGWNRDDSPVTASPSARPVPLETRQRLVRFRGYLRERMGEHQ